jgi:predicted membrane-bound spermidine synthase
VERAQTPPASVPIGFLYLVSVVEGAAVMAVELVAARMIGVYFGNSLDVWAAVLAVTLFGLASGYYLGGVVSDRASGAGVLFAVVGLSAVLVAAMPYWGDLLMRGSLSFEVQTASLVAAMLFLFPPLVCFGAVSPLVVELISRDRRRAGRAAGTVYAISTVGGILMTLLVGFYLIPRLGLRVSALGVAAGLCLLPVAYFVRRRRWTAALLVVLPVIVAVTSGWGQARIKNAGRFQILHISDGLLGQLAVLETVRPDTQETVRVLLINNVSQNLVHVPSFRSKWRYVHRIALYSSLQPAGSRVLVCGLGGGNLINEFDRLGFRIDAVEIDPRMEGLAREWFGMRGDARVFVDDARHFIKARSERYSIVVFDMASGDVQPVNVYTVEAFRELRSRIEPDGMLFLHYQNRLSGEGALAVESLGRTLAAAGWSVRLLDTGVDPTRVGEIVFVATPDPDLFDRLRRSDFPRRDRFADPFQFPRGDEMFAEYSFDGGLLLTDDWPILEHLHQPAVEQIRGEAFRRQLAELIADRVRFL